jgi:hypothetical protein
VLAQHLFAGRTVLDIRERHHGAPAVAHLERHRDVGDREYRAVAPNEPVQIACDGLARGPREQHRRVGGGVRRPVRVPVVDRLVAVAPEQVVRAVIAERGDRGGVGEPDHPFGIHHPDRLNACADWATPQEPDPADPDQEGQGPPPRGPSLWQQLAGMEIETSGGGDDRPPRVAMNDDLFKPSGRGRPERFVKRRPAPRGKRPLRGFGSTSGGGGLRTHEGPRWPLAVFKTMARMSAFPLWQ